MGDALRVLLALGAGALLPLSMAPFGYWPLALVSVALLFELIQRRPQRLIVLGVAFGLGKYAVGVSWVFFSIHRYGNASVPLALFLVALFVVVLTALFVLTQFLVLKLLHDPSAPRGRNALAFVALFVLWEWLQTWVLTGFPWLLAGAGQLDGPLGGFAPLGGVLLVSCAVLTVALSASTALAALFERRFRDGGRAALVATLVTLGGLGAGTLTFVELDVPRSVALVQGNVDQATKWQPENRERIVQRYADLSEPHWGRDLIIWPEAAITLLEHQATGRLRQWQARGERRGTTLVLGLPSIEPDPLAPAGYHFYNLARAVGAGSGRYSKRRLVPFGEYVPLESLLRGAIDFFDLPMSRARPGAWSQPLLDLDGVPAAMAICYEIAYPNLVVADLPEAQVLLTISNDAWFGASIGPHQHLELARMRARETGRYVLRGTNNGLTAIIDERGQILDQLAQFQPGVLVGEFRPATGATPFARFGATPALALVVLALIAVLFLRVSKAAAASVRR